MRVALVTDTHYGIRNDSVVFYDYMKLSNDYFFSYLEENNIEQIIHLGDLYDRKKYINYVTSYRCRTDFLDRIEYSKKLKMDVIAGNHDIYHKNTNEINSLNELVRGYNRIKVYTDPVEVKYGVPILLLPWICPDNYDESISAINRTPAKIALGHLELNGFETQKGVVHQGGMEAKVLDKFDLVCSGHFHHKSSIGKINYLGAAYEFAWSDWNDPRGFTILDTDTMELEFIQNPYRLFHMIAYDDAQNKDSILNDVENANFSHYKNSYIKIVAVNRKDPTLFDRYMDKIYRAGATDITVVEDMNLFTDDLSEEELISEGEDTITLFNRYIDGITVNVNSSKLKNYIKTIYMEAEALEKA